MKKNKLIILGVAAAFALAVTSCVKKIDIPQSNKATVTLAASGANYVTSDITVNAKDSLLFSFNIACAGDMKYVSLQKNGADILRDTLNSTNKNSFSAIKRIAADSIAGIYVYRVVARDVQGIYMGSRDITVTVTADFKYYTVRILQVPDSNAKTNTCYFSSTNGNTYSYSTGAANSALIDFGYYYDTTSANKHTIYALSAAQTQLGFYDISSWTKNATIFKRVTTPTFASITSKGALRTAGIANLASGTASKIVTATPSKTNLTNDVILFKTAAGKYGIMTINYTNQESASAGTFINIDVKVEN